MAFNSNGQISYLVLDSLKDGAKYGLEIIEYISKKTNGGFVMKKPTLYSCLTRMEKKGLVSSSFWGESDLGGKRHYYSITNAGKEALAELENSVDEMNFESEEPAQKPEPIAQETEQKPTFLQQDNLFDMVKEEQPAPKAEPKEDSDVLENQIDIFNMDPVANNLAEEEKEGQETENQEKIEYYQSILEQEKPQDDAVFLADNERENLTSEQEEQNRRLYDTSSELKKYRKKKSFSENQIEMSVVYQKEEDDEIQKERIAELKRSILNLRQNTPVEEETEEAEVAEAPAPAENIEEEAETHDDAVFITEPRMSENEIPVQRKIAPTNIDVNIFDDNLPAPKRDSALEPSYRDILSKIFEKKKERTNLATPPRTETIQEYQAPQNFGDYSSLKKHYQSNGIDFKEYKKSSVNRRYNTNLLQLINSVVLFVLSGLSSAILFWIISATGNLKASTNFMYYTFPIIFAVYALYSLIKFKCFSSKKAAIKINEATNWIVFLLSTLIIVIVNTICGMQAELMAKYLTSLLVPIINILILFPIHFYCKKFLYSKYSR